MDWRRSAALTACFLLAATAAEAQGAGDAGAVATGWKNTTDLSFVFIEGNSEAETFGFKNLLVRRWEKGRFHLKLDAVRSDTADDRFVQVTPGVTWLPGDPVPQASTRIVAPDVEPDVEKYFAEAVYSRQIVESFNWRAGGSWDRNEDAGILNRYIAFAGLGHHWRDTDRLRLHSGYSLSYTDREEQTPDPEKDGTFAGIRLDGTLDAKLTESVKLENNVTGNMSLEDTADYSIEANNGVSVTMTSRLSLSVSFRWLYNNEPALDDFDVVANAIVIDPDGIPGSGDEFFQTVPSGGVKFDLGERKERLEPLDRIFRVSLRVDL